MCVFVRQLNCFWVVFDVGMCERNSQSKILWLLFKTVSVLHKNCEFSASSCISMLHLPTVPRTHSLNSPVTVDMFTLARYLLLVIVL